MKGQLSVRNLSKRFKMSGGLLRRAHWLTAIDDVSFEIPAGTTFGLVGESGCGKSTLARCLLRLCSIDQGSVRLDNLELTSLSKAELFNLRKRMQVIFQDPYASLSPRRTVEQTLLEPLETHAVGDDHSRRQRVRELLEMVGLREGVLHRYPHEFSGGQRQRVGIARALALKPDFVVADEAVSALDVSVQSQVLNLLRDIQEEQGIGYLFISHDLAVVQHISDNVGVMYMGRLVESSSADTIFQTPKHPYTKALMQAVPVADPALRPTQSALQGEVPSPLDLPSGCPFHTRCPKALDHCSTVMPDLIDIGDGNQAHWVRCHLHSLPNQETR